jgi:mRNA-degrading endonuclease RelE of RelBE toxin-antitoxin system
MRFIETQVFTSELAGLLNAEEYRRLQLALALRPEQGAVIRGSGGLRKIRWGASGRGKRGGIRVIYYWDPAGEACYMLFVYPKTEQGDLTQAQLKMLRRLVQEEFK